MTAKQRASFRDHVQALAAPTIMGKALDVGDELALDSIITDGETQVRAVMNDERIQDYAQAMRDGAQFQLIDVYYDGTNHWLADGFHRVAAAKIAGKETIRATVHQGDQRAAILHAVGANETHGFRRSRDDARRGIVRLLNDAEWGQWSDREIARRCAVSPSTVATVRAELSVQIGQIAPATRMVERGGTTYQQKPPAKKPSAPPAPQPAEAAAPTLPIPPDLIGWRWEASPPNTYQLTNGTHTTNREEHPHHAIVAARNLRDAPPLERAPAVAAHAAAVCTSDGCDQPGVGTHQIGPQGDWRWFCATHAPQIAERHRADWRDRLIDAVAAPDPDAQHMIAVERILKEAEPHGGRTGTKLYQEAYAAAREIRDITLYNKAFALIDRAVERTMHAPPIIASNDGWRGERPTVAQALLLAEDRERQKKAARDRRLTPGAHAHAITLLISIRTALITEQIAGAEQQARQLLAIIETGEATD